MLVLSLVYKYLEIYKKLISLNFGLKKYKDNI